MSIPDSSASELRTMLKDLVPFGEPAWSAALPHLVERRLLAGEHLLQPGDRVDDVLFLTRGIARYYYLDPRGREFTKSFVTPGGVMSSIQSLVAGSPAPFHIQTLSSARAAGLPYCAFLQLAAEFAEWQALRIRLLELLAMKKERRESDLLQLSATERYLQFLSEQPELAAGVSNYHVASYLGITEVALSRIRSRLGLTRVNAAAPG